MNREVSLLYTTGVPAIDLMLKGIIGFCELLFPGRIRGYYLQGSYASGDATPVSDIDMVFLFKDTYSSVEEKEQARCVDTFSEWLAGRQLDITPATEQELLSTDLVDATTIMHFKVGSKLLFGEDIGDGIESPSHALYSRACMYHALRAISWHHHHPQPLRFPLRYPDEDAEFYGFNQYMYSVGETRSLGTERLVYAVIRIAGALVSLRTERLVFSKRSCVRAYREQIGGEWADFVTEVFETCHDQWSNQVPTDKADRHRLRHIYSRMLDFENFFLSIYQETLMQDLDSLDERLRNAAAERLALTFQQATL